MNRKTAVFIVVAALIFSCPAAHAATDDILAGMGKKFIRGLTNTVTGWAELPVQTMRGYKKGRPTGGSRHVWGAVYGLFKGIGCAVGRTAWGVVELAGFWTANPEDNIGIGIPLDAEYVWQEGEPYGYFNPSFNEASLRPMGRKILRGLENTFLGLAEFPGHAIKGFQDKKPCRGIIKGLWFSASREIYGIADIATAVFPSVEDNPGYAFDREYPWDVIVDVLEE